VKTNLPLLLFTTGVRRLYIPLRIRVRQWGALPYPRGPVVLITNHQHVDEGETVFARTIWRHPRVPIVAVNSRRTFETGFFASRLPWTKAFTRKLNLSGLWLSLSLLPIENHLYSRPLASFAEEIRAAHGDLPLDAFLGADTIAELGLHGRRISDLWTARDFTRGQAWVKLRSLLQPYQREATANFRAVTTRDIAAVVERVRAGATFYVTPEGDFSRDGTLHPLRNGLTNAVLPYADPWLCAIAYDPFRGRRLSMLYRIVRPARLDDLDASLAAARPVVTSALLATFLGRSDGAFAAADARDDVRAQLAALPRGVFADPELLQAPDAAVDEALANLVARGTLAADGPRYRLTGVRADPRFPHVDDMTAYQRNMLAETLAAAEKLAGGGG
jgi:hypothetical protein